MSAFAEVRTASAVSRVLSELSERVPERFRADEYGFGWALSLAIAVLEQQRLRLLTSGIFGAVMCRGVAAETLHSPRKLTDELLASGKFTAAEVQAANVHHVFTERLFGDDHCELTARGPFALRSGDRVVVGHRDVLDMDPANLCALVGAGATAVLARAVALQCHRGPIATLAIHD